MTDLNAIYATAQKRAETYSLAYTGAVTPQEAFEVLQANPSAILVDVRSQAELDLVGKVPGATHIEWAFYPGMVPNAAFGQQLSEKIDQNQTIIFMCRTGGRSHNAAVLAQQLGFSQVFNMLEGFEGEANLLKQRTLINGWKFAGLPWCN